MDLRLTSSAFSEGGEIPSIHTCDGPDLSPALNWSLLPDSTRSLVLIVDDPDAPDPRAPKMVWVHWVLYNIPPATGGLAEAMDTEDLPPGTLEGLNDWRETGYRGPCPPTGKHRYFFKLYCLDVILPDLETPTKKELQSAMEGHVIAETSLMGRYQRS